MKSRDVCLNKYVCSKTYAQRKAKWRIYLTRMIWIYYGEKLANEWKPMGTYFENCLYSSLLLHAILKCQALATKQLKWKLR